MYRESNLKLYLLSKNVSVEPFNFEHPIKSNEYDHIIDHINIIDEFQSLFSECDNVFALKIPSAIWREIETFKMINRRGERVLKNIDSLEVNTIVKQAIKCISIVEKLPFDSMISRAMNKHEVCIGKPYYSNICKGDNIRINDISKISFNLYENDCYKYLKRLKRRKKKY